MLLHGFPELSRSWRHQLPALAAAGFRAVAPDLRGYGRTERRGPYDARTLVADVVSLVRALGRERAAVVGHDWGGAIAWWAAHGAPEVVERLAVLNCPHPAVMAREVVRNPRQLARSAYVFFFLVPRLPERWLTANGACNVARILRGGSKVRSAWPEDEVARYREALLQPGAASAALAYYRANARRVGAWTRSAGRPPIAAPTLVLWATGDRALGEELVDPRKLAPFFAPGNEPEIVRLDGVGHFVQNEAPERVNAELLRWLARNRTSDSSQRRV